MKASEVIFLGEKESFIIRVLAKKVEEAGYTCEYVPLKINAINDKWKDNQLLVLFMDDGNLPPDEVLHFLADNMEERGGCMILIGETDDFHYVVERISENFVYTVFARPVDNTEFVETVGDYFKKMALGEVKKSILIVDDDPGYLNLVRQWLKEDYKVAMANSGMQAIKYLSKNKVDLILLDHEMPVTSGPQVLEMLRSEEETKHIPVMFLTGKSDKESVMAVVALRPEGYFLKTIQREELLEKLQEFFVLHKQ